MTALVVGIRLVLVLIGSVTMVIVALIPMLLLAQHLQTVNVQPLFENLFYLFVFLFLFPLNSSLSLAKLLYGRFIT